MATRSAGGSPPALVRARPWLLAWLLLLGAELALQPYRAWRLADTSDWVGFATAGRIVADGLGAHLFDLGVQRTVQAGVVGHPLVDHFWNYANPPLVAWLLQPVAALPVTTGATVWAAVTTSCLLATVAVLASLLPQRWSPATRALVAACAGLALPMIDGVGLGQLTPVVLLSTTLAVRQLRRSGDGIIPGLLLSIGLVKPQLVFIVVPVLLVAGCRRTLLGVATGAAVWLGSALLIVGGQGIADWAASFVPAGYVDTAAMGVGLPGLAASAGVPARVAFAASLLLAAAAVAVLARRRGALRADPAGAVATAVAISTLCSPHAFARDLALVLAAARCPAQACLLGVGIGVAFLLDDLAPLAGGHLTEPLVVLAVVLTWPGRRTWLTTRRGGVAPASRHPMPSATAACPTPVAVPATVSPR